GADFAGHAGHFGSEPVQLVHHRVDGGLELEDFALHIDRDFFGEVAVGHGGGDGGDVADLAGEVVGHEVHVAGKVLPGAGDAGDLGLAAELAFRADFAGDPRDFGGEGAKLIHHRIDGVLELEDFAAHVHGDSLGEVAVGDGGGHFGNVADLAREVCG